MFYRPHQKKILPWSRQHRVSSSNPKKRAVAHDPWEFNSIPADDREWMRQNASSQDKEALSRAITGGCEVDGDD